MRPLDDDIRAAYLSRLGLEAEPPSAEALARLHRRHVERVPYETWWIHGGEAWDIDVAAAAARIAFHRRGGYCYHLNGAFAALLSTLGYAVGLHTGGVHGPAGPAPADAGNHLVVNVTGLPTDDNPSGDWFVDVGLGDALHEPMPLRPGHAQQGPFALALEQCPGVAEGAWQLRHDPAGGFSGMVWHRAPADAVLLAAQHQWQSSSPESGFVRVGLAQTRDASGVSVVHGLVVKRIGAGARTSEPLTDRRAWFGALEDLFGLTFAASPPGTTERLWKRALAAHRAWEAARQA